MCAEKSMTGSGRKKRLLMNINKENEFMSLSRMCAKRNHLAKTSTFDLDKTVHMQK